jgi:hypothetical protein
MTIHSVPGEIKAVTTQEIEAKQHQEEAEQLEHEAKQQQEAVKKAEEHTKQVGEEAKRYEAELDAEIAAIKQRQEEEAAKKKQEESKPKPPTRAQLLSKALGQCKKEPKSKHAHCIAEATKKYGRRAKTGKK